MIIAGITIMAVAVVITSISVGLEIKMREPVWAITMKIGAVLLAVGAVIFGVAMSL